MVSASAKLKTFPAAHPHVLPPVVWDSHMNIYDGFMLYQKHKNNIVHLPPPGPRKVA